MASFVGNPMSLIGALLFCIIIVAEATKTELIDDNGVESVAQAVCSRSMGSYTQIGSVSTIKQLVAFFDNFPQNHKLKACRDTNLDALRLLNDLVSTRNDNVCSDEKISLIEKFHHRYISRTKKDKAQQKLDNAHEVPKLLKNFFYHYATQVATTCKSSLVESLKEAEETAEGDLKDPENIEKVDKFLREFSFMVGSTSGTFKAYSEISLLWNYVDRLPIKEDNKYIRKEGKRVALEVEDEADNMKAFQRECLTRLKPVYGVLALPVIRLIDLGYHQNDEPFAAELDKRADLRRLIGVAQVCEFMLPIRIIASKGLTVQGGMTLLEKEFADEIPLDEEEEKLEPIALPEDHRSSLEDLINLPTVTPEGAHQFVKTVRANVKARDKVLRSLIEKITSNLSGKVKSLVGRAFCMRKENGKDVKKHLIEEDDSGVEKFSVMREIKSMGRAAWYRFLDHMAVLIGLTFAAGPIVLFVLPFLAAMWIFDIMRGLFIGILFALYVVVGLPMINFYQRQQDGPKRVEGYLLERLI